MPAKHQLRVCLLPCGCGCSLQTRDADRKRDARPSRTLFVVNFDLGRTRERDLERHFEPYGEQPVVLVAAYRSSQLLCVQHPWCLWM
jgi:hypothetical protein